jgi:hypothetical protein
MDSVRRMAPIRLTSGQLRTPAIIICGSWWIGVAGAFAAALCEELLPVFGDLGHVAADECEELAHLVEPVAGRGRDT